MRFYIASSFENKDMVRYVSQKLLSRGFTHTYDWTMNQRAIEPKSLNAIGEQEKNAVESSDIFIMLLPAGKSSHVELGITLGLGKLIYIYSPEKIKPATASTFYYVDGVNRISGEIDRFISMIGVV
ncbi:TIR domain-containing protein [Virgibacillus necropolis]|uniref:Group-specific protein n=1 Tax=Virgibacillus necropolis TaxID=163877 RepID=A0A221M875_9BACI|nr:group-specific protein [Virgibacillus necropolis]ASN03838.1 group-specific protein [Virgibacillus necropolis]